MKRLGLLLLAGLALLAASGCDEDPPTSPPLRAGIITGVISDGGEFDSTAVRVQVEAFSDDGPDLHISTRPDRNGRYVMTVPSGDVILSIGVYGESYYYRAGGLTGYSADADSLHIGEDVHQIDFRLGRATVDLGLPPLLVGEYVWCGLESVAERPILVSDDFGVRERMVARFRMVMPARYRIQAHIREDEQRFYLPASYDTAGAAIIDVVPGEETTYTSNIEAMTVLAGTVSGSWQTFGSEAPVVTALLGHEFAGRTAVDAGGAFQLDLICGGPFRLQVSIGGIHQFIGGGDDDSATIFYLESGGQLHGISHVESGLECLLVGATSEDRWWVNLYDAVTGWSLCGTSAGGDTLRLSNLPAGGVLLHVEATPDTSLWMPQFFDGAAVIESATPIVIPAGGQIARISMDLVVGGRIRGRLLAADGSAFDPGDLYIDIYLAQDSHARFHRYYMSRLYQPETGDYSLNQLLDGQYKLRVCLRDHPCYWWPAVADWDSAGVITIENHAEVTGIDMRLPY